MIKTLTLGNVTFPNNLIQGPLAGISSAPFRALTWQYSQPAFSCTEMLSCKTLITKSQFACRRFLHKHPSEGQLCLQLSATNPTELGHAVQIATDEGVDLVDLNCGCPVKKIRSKGAGSSLLSEASRLYQLILAMKKNTHLPVSIKIRVDGKSNDRNNAEIVKVVSDAGLDFLIVHGRHWTEGYETRCHYDQIHFFTEELSIPVIGNGDIACIDSLQYMLETNCAGVMISRAGVGQPWLINKLKSEMNQKTFVTPCSQTIGRIFVEHISQLSELLGAERFAMLQARTLAKYYARKLPTKNEFCEAINTCNDLQNFSDICFSYFGEK